MAVGLSVWTFGGTRTVKMLIEGAFRTAHILGRDEPVGADEANEAGLKLNDIIEQATIKKPFSTFNAEIVVPLVAGQFRYLIGPALADVISPRPVEILSGFTRRESIDVPLSITHAKEDYDRISYKSLSVAGWHASVYYQATYPSGTLYVSPVPKDNLATIYLTVSADLAPYQALEDPVVLPPVYYSWMQYKLAERLAPDYGQVWSDDNKAILLDLEESLMSNNIKPMPMSITGIGALGQAGQSGTRSGTDIRGLL